MVYLASELQKYYHKAQNKLIFYNGMSLNQLALEMWTVLGYKGMDPSLLSRIIHGERLFTKEQLFAFCTTLGLNEIEKYSLENALGKDLLYKHFGEVVPISQYDDLIAGEKISSMILLGIRKLKDKGEVQEAMQMASFFEQALTFTPKIQQTNKSLFAKILNEKVRCLHYTEKPNTILAKSQQMNDVALKIGYETKDSDIISLSHALIGGCFYIAKRLKESAGYLEKTFPIVNEKIKVEYIRTLLYNYSSLHDFDSFKGVYKKAEKILSEREKYNKNDIASMHEAISRSLAIMGEFGAAKKFLRFVDTSNIHVYYQSQIVRGKMFICYQEHLKNKNVDRDEIKQIFHESKHGAFSAFSRHRSQIANMYQQMCYE